MTGGRAHASLDPRGGQVLDGRVPQKDRLKDSLWLGREEKGRKRERGRREAEAHKKMIIFERHSFEWPALINRGDSHFYQSSFIIHLHHSSSIINRQSSSSSCVVIISGIGVRDASTSSSPSRTVAAAADAPVSAAAAASAAAAG